MQTDPNIANYSLEVVTGRIVILDFGAARAFGEEIVEQYSGLFGHGIAQDWDALEDVAERIGFFASDTRAEHRAQVMKMMRLIFGEIGAVDQFDFGKTDLSRRMNAEGEILAESGFIPPPLPMDVLYLQRKFAGMFLLAARLKARVPVRQIIERWTGSL